MKLIIKDITTDNLFEILNLTTNATGTVTLIENFVASNVLSIAQSKFYPNTNIRAFYDNQTPIGFAMYGVDENDKNLWISRFMIDYRYQNKGYGKKAFLLLLDEIKNNFDESEIYLSFEPENTIAKNLYTACGFIDQNKIIDGESVYKLTV